MYFKPHVLLCLCGSYLVFVTGQDGAGFYPQGPAATWARGVFFRAIPAPSTFQDESPLIPWTEPCFSPHQENVF